MNAVIEDLQDRIDEADSHLHTSEEVARYRTRDHLESLIRSALEKGYGQGARPKLPYFNKPPLGLDEGVEKLKTSIQSFLNDVFYFHNNRSRLPHEAPNLAIKATAGLGKTSQIIEWAMTWGIFNNGEHIEYYVPTHALSAQVEADILEAFEATRSRLEHADDEVSVITIKGRDHVTDGGVHYCPKSSLADKLIKAGLSVQAHLCANYQEQCEHFDTCEYQRQFRRSNWPPEGRERIYIPAVSIMAHNHLFLNKREE